MEVCIFGVLTVNLLTFCSQSAPFHLKCALSRCLLKMAGWALAEKSSNALLQPVLRAYMMAGERHKWWQKEGINDASRRGWIMHREGRNVASRRNGECIAMQKKGLFRAENYELRGRKLWVSFVNGRENNKAILFSYRKNIASLPSLKRRSRMLILGWKLYFCS